VNTLTTTLKNKSTLNIVQKIMPWFSSSHNRTELLLLLLNFFKLSSLTLGHAEPYNSYWIWRLVYILTKRCTTVLISPHTIILVCLSPGFRLVERALSQMSAQSAAPIVTAMSVCSMRCVQLSTVTSFKAVSALANRSALNTVMVVIDGIGSQCATTHLSPYHPSHLLEIWVFYLTPVG
jgi:hypothetical protein